MSPLAVDQTLHGYRDGHELLASSLQVPRDARRTLLSMSDLSGPGFIDGFDGYLTGYPITAFGKYALGRTWYAPEMDRPGCVWTHTLFVDFSDIPRLESPRVLLRHFQQPKSVERIAQYERRLEVTPSEAACSSQAIDEVVGLRLLEVLYRDDQAPVLVQSSHVGVYDDLIFALWAQQWPRLRRGFSFCTGAFSLRAVNKTPLDLQIVPTKRWARVLRTDRSARTVEPGRGDGHAGQEEWLAAAIGDLERGGSPLRSYLREYGADAPGHRASFRPLARSFITQERVRRGRASLDQLVSVVGEGFAEKASAARLKRDLLGPKQARTEDGDLAVSETDRVLAALRTNCESSFDLRDLGIEERALKLVRSGLAGDGAFLRQLLDAHINRTGQQVLDRALLEIDVDSLGVFFETDATLFERVLLARPSLFYEDELWRTPRHLQRECVAHAGRAAASSIDVSRLLGAALSAGSTAIVGDAYEFWGKRVVHAALAWVDDSPSEVRALGERWRALLRSCIADTIEWLGTEGKPARTETLGLLPDLVDVGDPSLDKVPSARLTEWARRVSQADESRADTEVLAFLLAIGLAREDEAACDLVVAAFPVVHEALLLSRLGWKAWSWLEPLMPSKDWFFSRDWDKADKLRRSLFVRIARNDWPAECMRAAAYSEQARCYLKKTAATSTSWKRIAREGFG